MITTLLTICVTLAMGDTGKPIVSSFAFEYQDCKAPERVERYAIPDCSKEMNDKQFTDKKTTLASVMTLKRVAVFPGVSCKAEISRFTGYCGAYSHFKWSEVPQVKKGVRISQEKCLKVTIDRTILDKNCKISDRHCVEDSVTHVWVVNTPGCNYERIKTINVFEVEKQLYLTDDGGHG